jgi:hypothetical protein
MTADANLCFAHKVRAESSDILLESHEHRLTDTRRLQDSSSAPASKCSSCGVDRPKMSRRTGESTNRMGLPLFRRQKFGR